MLLTDLIHAALSFLSFYFSWSCCSSLSLRFSICDIRQVLVLLSSVSVVSEQNAHDYRCINNILIVEKSSHMKYLISVYTPEQSSRLLNESARVGLLFPLYSYM